MLARRNPRRLLRGFWHLPRFLMASWRALFIFEDPVSVIWSYVRRCRPAGAIVRLRSGITIHLSDDPADIVTVFLIFARRDYGEVTAGATVIDVGANIGVFSLFAASSGAKAVHAFEPSAASHAILLKNIKTNSLRSVIHANHRAVVGRPRASVKFPRRSNVLNEILPESADAAACDVVPATTLSEITASLDSIDLLKSDCEGAEYDIFLNTPSADIRRIAEIRMECHEGPLQELLTRLSESGFEVHRYMAAAAGGYVQFWRGDPPPVAGSMQ